MKVGISNCLYADGYSDKRRMLDRAVLAYYNTLNPSGYELILHAVGSSDKDRKDAEGNGWLYMDRSNDVRGKKRNDALLELAPMCDVVVRIGSDDLLSLALLDEVVARAKAGHHKYWELKGYYMYDLPTGKLALFDRLQYALAIMAVSLKDGSHQEALATDPDDSGLDARWRSWGSPWTRIVHDESRPMVSVSSGDELHGYKYWTHHQPLLCSHHEGGPDYIAKHFPGFDVLSVSPKRIENPRKKTKLGSKPGKTSQKTEE